MAAVPDRAEIVAILAAFGDRPPEQVPEGIDSMELAWLVHQLEQRYDYRLDDDALIRMTTVSDALKVLGELPAATTDPSGAGSPGPNPLDLNPPGAGSPGTDPPEPAPERPDHA